MARPLGKARRQLTIWDDTSAKLRKLSEETGKAQTELMDEATDDLIRKYDMIDRQQKGRK